MHEGKSLYLQGDTPDLFMSEMGPFKAGDYLEIQSVSTEATKVSNPIVGIENSPSFSFVPGTVSKELGLVSRLSDQFLRETHERRKNLVITIIKPLADVHGLKAGTQVNIRKLIPDLETEEIINSPDRKKMGSGFQPN